VLLVNITYTVYTFLMCHRPLLVHVERLRPLPLQEVYMVVSIIVRAGARAANESIQRIPIGFAQGAQRLAHLRPFTRTGGQDDRPVRRVKAHRLGGPVRRPWEVLGHGSYLASCNHLGQAGSGQQEVATQPMAFQWQAEQAE
jgi:hypothetical protein